MGPVRKAKAEKNSGTGRLFVGIDLAFAKNKQLPICIVRIDAGRLLPLVSQGLPPIPRGSGNVASLRPVIVRKFASDLSAYLHAAEALHEAHIDVIGIDAPADYSLDGWRKGERALIANGIRCFATPSEVGFREIKRKVRKHLREGGAENRLPHANQLWMLVGFALFRELEQHYRCLEVFPQAIVHRLGASSVHKFQKQGFQAQLKAVAKATGWTPASLARMLGRCVSGAGHDRLDAYMCAWVASLYPDLDVYGQPPNDAIWVPKLEQRNRL